MVGQEGIPKSGSFAMFRLVRKTGTTETSEWFFLWASYSFGVPVEIETQRVWSLRDMQLALVRDALSNGHGVRVHHEADSNFVRTLWVLRPD